MNTITMIVTILTLWLVMGLGFLSKYADMRRQGRPSLEAWKTNEGLLFIASVAVPVLAVLVKTIVG
ncbi:MAG: hypothetical protein ABIL58_11635 [Pseudomonadota bacterium]